MPILKYKCDYCGHVFTLFQQTDVENTYCCPKCSGTVKLIEVVSSNSDVQELHSDVVDDYRSY